jgi:hypothetical protein
VESVCDFERALSVQKTAINHRLHQKAVRDDLAAIDSRLIIWHDRPPLDAVDAGSCVSFGGIQRDQYRQACEKTIDPASTVSRTTLYNMVLFLLSVVLAAIVVGSPRIRNRIAPGGWRGLGIARGDFSIARGRAEQPRITGPMKMFLKLKSEPNRNRDFTRWTGSPTSKELKKRRSSASRRISRSGLIG